MNSLRTFSKILVLIFLLGDYTFAMATPVNGCWRASFEISPSETTILTEDQEEGIRYFSFEKLKFGVKSKTQDSLIRINQLEINLSEITWQFRPGITTEIKVNNNDVNTMLAEASKIKVGKIWYCLSMPFSGLGSSGNFAKYKVVLAIPKNANYNSEIFGMVGSNTSAK